MALPEPTTTKRNRNLFAKVHYCTDCIKISSGRERERLIAKAKEYWAEVEKRKLAEVYDEWKGFSNKSEYTEYLFTIAKKGETFIR